MSNADRTKQALLRIAAGERDAHSELLTATVLDVHQAVNKIVEEESISNDDLERLGDWLVSLSNRLKTVERVHRHWRN